MEEIHNFIGETQKGASTKDKNIQNEVKQLIVVKDHIDSVTLKNDEIVLKLDCVDESIKCFIAHEFNKDSQSKQIKKLFDEWAHLKKLAKDIKKEISPLV